MIIKKKFNHFFNKKEIIFYHNKNDLSDKLNFYKKNENERRLIAKNGQKKYFKLFNEIEVAKYIVNESLGNNNFKPKWYDYLN